MNVVKVTITTEDKKLQDKFDHYMQVMAMYRRSGNFCVEKLLYHKFSYKKIFIGMTPYHVSVNSMH